MRRATDDIWIGDLNDAWKVLQKPKAQHIKSILSVCYTRLPIKKGIPRLIIPIEDGGEFDIRLFDAAIAFVDAAPKPCLVHCDAGVSRSTTFAAAYLWWKQWTTADSCGPLHENCNPQSLVDVIDKCRSPMAYPSPGVMNQLITWAESHGFQHRDELMGKPAFDTYYQRAGVKAPQKPRQEVNLFAKLMERKLRMRDSLHGDKWKEAPRAYLRKRLLEELAEADESDGPEEYADVANFAMFMAFRDREPAYYCKKCGNEWPIESQRKDVPPLCLICGNDDIGKRE